MYGDGVIRLHNHVYQTQFHFACGVSALTAARRSAVRRYQPSTGISPS